MGGWVFDYVVAFTNIAILGETYNSLPSTGKVCKGVQKCQTYAYLWQQQKTINIK